jgi:hypothetical protein
LLAFGAEGVHDIVLVGGREMGRNFVAVDEYFEVERASRDCNISVVEQHDGLDLDSMPLRIHGVVDAQGLHGPHSIQMSRILLVHSSVVVAHHSKSPVDFLGVQFEKVLHTDLNAGEQV